MRLKFILILGLFWFFSTFFARSQTISPINETYLNNIVSAIYRVEGGNKTKFPYGIKSINTYGDKTYARKICINTVRNNWRRYQKLNDKSKYHCFLDFLADRYCPRACDSTGNKNWKQNIHKILDVPIKKR